MNQMKIKRLRPSRELGVSPQQRINIAKLAIFVHENVETAKCKTKFNIKFYSNVTPYPNKMREQCGTSACLLGFGPLAGITLYSETTDWLSYAYSNFINLRIDLYSFLFGGRHLNSASAAVRRAAYFLQLGLPKHTDDNLPVELDTWEVPQLFDPDWEAIKRLAGTKLKKCKK